jgi:hypothetical protein
MDHDVFAEWGQHGEILRDSIFPIARKQAWWRNGLPNGNMSGDISDWCDDLASDFEPEGTGDWIPLRSGLKIRADKWCLSKDSQKVKRSNRRHPRQNQILPVEPSRLVQSPHHLPVTTTTPKKVARSIGSSFTHLLWPPRCLSPWN